MVPHTFRTGLLPQLILSGKTQVDTPQISDSNLPDKFKHGDISLTRYLLSVAALLNLEAVSLMRVLSPGTLTEQVLLPRNNLSFYLDFLEGVMEVCLLPTKQTVV